MAFVPTIMELESALQRSGCPICRVNRDGGDRFQRSVLWEYVNDPGLRMQMVDSLGYCPRHARRFVALEREMWGAAAARFLVGDTIRRLDRHAGDMREFVRKQDWNYRHEKTNENEKRALSRAMALFTGFPSSEFGGSSSGNERTVPEERRACAEDQER